VEMLVYQPPRWQNQNSTHGMLGLPVRTGVENFIPGSGTFKNILAGIG